jgi:hypothetical protein
MPDDEKKPDQKPFHLSIAKRFILRENKIAEEEINKIQSNAEAEELITLLGKRENTAEDEQDPNARMNNMGNDDFKLPEPKNPNYDITLGMDDYLKPARINNFLKDGVFEQGARIMRVFGDDNYPEGRVI